MLQDPTKQGIGECVRQTRSPLRGSRKGQPLRKASEIALKLKNLYVTLLQVREFVCTAANIAVAIRPPGFSRKAIEGTRPGSQPNDFTYNMYRGREKTLKDDRLYAGLHASGF